MPHQVSEVSGLGLGSPGRSVRPVSPGSLGPTVGPCAPVSGLRMLGHGHPLQPPPEEDPTGPPNSEAGYFHSIKQC